MTRQAEQTRHRARRRAGIWINVRQKAAEGGAVPEAIPSEESHERGDEGRQPLKIRL